MPRNSSGTYTLPAGNPVAPNTLIETNWANPTLSDVASAITDSLDRLGRGTMLAPLKIFDGTALAPALSFNSEATLGLFRPIAGALGVAVGGVEVARFVAAGLTLMAGLTIGSVAADPFVINSNTATIPNGLTFAGLNLGLRGNSGGDVTALVKNDGAGRAVVSVDAGGTSDAEVRLLQAGVNKWCLQGGAAFSIRDDVAGLVRVTVTDEGNVGINGVPNTFGANYKVLTITGGSGGALLQAAGGPVLGEIYASNAESLVAIGSRSNHPVSINIAAVERMRITTAGNVGIGQNPATRKLEINAVPSAPNQLGGIRLMAGAVASSLSEFLLGLDAGGVPFTSIRTGSDGNAYMTFFTGAGPIERMRIDSVGNIGISAPPTAGVKVYIRGTSNSTTYGANGDVRVASLNETVTTSYGWNQFHCSDHFTMGSAGVATARLEGSIFNLMAGSGFLRIAGHITRFYSEVACPAVAGAASLTTAVHGGSRVPDYFRVLLRCVIAESGYAPGDYVEMVPLPGTATYSTAANAANITWRAPATVAGPPVVYVASGVNTVATVTPANWRLAFFAMWL